MALIVYGSNVSPFVRKVLVVLAEKGAEYTLDPVNPFSPPPGFTDISPLKRIPVLRDTDRSEPNTLPDSSVICDYLDRKFPTPPLYPQEAFARARALWFEEYADSVLAQSIGPGLFFERIVKKLLGQTPDESVCAVTMNDKLPPLFDYLEKQIGASAYLVGDAFSIADIAVCTMLVNMRHAGEAVDAKRWPRFAAYSANILARPSFAKCVEGEARFIARVRGS